ncbi:hypothetical protein CANARDRAFT_233251 [[Candida] arabinofermentans NRRL YB-2248]|uniref:CASTOR ACT domain-containing protein n=1 Tax=[Candida] arabinofermentans NRRL YB-2248 TaxID=983967 RepID=A0A1E4T2S1_9ASCO|nr:hypothetical protein CANARDRAFT_233251 [[Candida] arabinofermentans NRRL YB-2248]
MLNSHEIQLYKTKISILTIPRENFWIFKSGVLQILYKLIYKMEGNTSDDDDDDDDKDASTVASVTSSSSSGSSSVEDIEVDDDGLFFQLAFTPEEVTLMCSTKLIKKYLSNPLKISNDPNNLIGSQLLDDEFLVLQMLNDGSNIGKKILELTEPLSMNDISIFFISNYFSDIVLIPSKQKQKAFHILEQEQLNATSSKKNELEERTFRLFKSSEVKPELNRSIKLLLTGARSGDSVEVLKKTAESLTKLCTEETKMKTKSNNFPSYFAITRTPTEEIGLVLPSSEREQKKLNYSKSSILGSSQDFYYPLFINLKNLPIDLKGIVAGVASKLLRAGLNEMSYLSLGKSDMSVRKMTTSIIKTSNKITTTTMPKYFDVGLNLTDEMFKGHYRNNKHHEEDIESVLKKAKFFNVSKVMLTGSSLKESEEAIRLANTYTDPIIYPKVSCTVGIHPCTVLEFEKNDNQPLNHLNDLRQLILKDDTGVIKAFGEIGLDYDRLYHTPIDKQQEYFKLQLELACEFDLPLFLHMRNACDDFITILKPFLSNSDNSSKHLKCKRLLVHSFSGTLEELNSILKLEDEFPNIEIFISVNGCSLKTEENCKVASQIPISKLMIETDSPWCEVRKTHHSYQYITQCPNEFYPFEYIDFDTLNQPVKKGAAKTSNEFLPVRQMKSTNLDKVQLIQGELDPLIKSRNEPCLIGFVAEIMSKLKGVEPQVLITTCYENSNRLFG